LSGQTLPFWNATQERRIDLDGPKAVLE